MKKIRLMISAAIVVSAFTACNNSDNVKKDVVDLSQYVDSVDKMEPLYTDAYWKTIETGYMDRNMKVEKNMSLIQSEDKETIDATKAK